MAILCGLLYYSGHSMKKVMLNLYLLTLAGWLPSSQKYLKEI